MAKNVYPRSVTDHIAESQGLDPDLEFLAGRIYGEDFSRCERYMLSGGCEYEYHNINPPCGSVKHAREMVEKVVRFGIANGILEMPEKKGKELGGNTIGTAWHTVGRAED